MRILVDPILVGNLDFGIPLLYDAAKKFLKNFKVIFFSIYFTDHSVINSALVIN